MANSESLDKVLQSGAGPLSRMFNLDEPELPDWGVKDLRAMLRHQLDAPMAYDLCRVTASAGGGKSIEPVLAQAVALGIKSFRDLFSHAEPPLELLQAVKNFFKHRSGASSERRPEQQVAYVLYLLAIVTAKVRRQKEITRLSDEEVLRGSRWAASQEWVDTGTKTLLTQFHPA